MSDEITNMLPREEKSSGAGAWIGTIIIIAIIIAGGWYYIGNRVEKINDQNKSAEINDTTSTSTELADIEADLNNVNIEALDQE